jgi:DNA-binding response OmpR family regulator
MRKAIIIIDRDMGFLLWLGSGLDCAGFKAFPARSVRAATALIAALHLTINAVIMDCSLRGARGFIAQIRRSGGQSVKVISLVGRPTSRSQFEVDGVCAKPTDPDDRSQAKLIQTVHNILLGFPNAGF